MTLPWRRLFGFGALQLFTATAPVLVLPVVVRIIGVEGWVGLSIGYAVGAATAIAVGLAWPMVGPSRVAHATPAEAADVFLESLVTRAVISLPVGALGTVVSALLSPPGHRVLAAAMCVATAAAGLASNWYYIGRGEPRGIFVYEALPKLVATAAAIPLVALTHLALLYPALLLVSSLGGVVASTHKILAPGPRTARMPDGAWRRVGHYAVVASSALVGAGYTSLAVPITKLSGAPLVQVADFAGSLRIRSMAQMAPASATSALQGWVSERTEDDSSAGRRMRQALAFNAVIGVGTALAVALLGPSASTVLFGSSADVSFELAAITGAACIPYAVSSSLSFHVLAPLGATGAVAASRVAATIVGVPLLFVLARADGARGAAVAALVSESLVAGIQAVVARRTWQAGPRVTTTDEELSPGNVVEF